MITAASLKEHTVKDLSQMAKTNGVTGWHSMKKDQLIKAIMKIHRAKEAKRSSKKKTSSRGAATTAKTRKVTRPTKPTVSRTKKVAKTTKPVKPAKAPKATKKSPTLKSEPAKPRVSRKVLKLNSEREKQKDLTTPQLPAKKKRVVPRPIPTKPIEVDRDRIVLMVRDPYWLHAVWEISRHNVERARAAMAEHWHSAKPILRLIEVETGTTTSMVEEVVREIPIHGCVRNWYIDVNDPPKSYRVEIGYLSREGTFFTLARSNCVTTPHPGSSTDLDENWADVAENYEKIYSMSRAHDEAETKNDLQELFEERLRRPMGSPLVSRFGTGASDPAKRHQNFPFDVEAEMIIYGHTHPGAHVTLSGEPVKLRPDGTFTIRQAMPDKRQVLPVVADSGDGVQQRTIVLAIERNTKVMEPVVREPNDS